MITTKFIARAYWAIIDSERGTYRYLFSDKRSAELAKIYAVRAKNSDFLGPIQLKRALGKLASNIDLNALTI